MAPAADSFDVTIMEITIKRVSLVMVNTRGKVTGNGHQAKPEWVPNSWLVYQRCSNLLSFSLVTCKKVTYNVSTSSGGGAASPHSAVNNEKNPDGMMERIDLYLLT